MSKKSWTPATSSPAALVPPEYTHGISPAAREILEAPLIPETDTVAERLRHHPCPNPVTKLAWIAGLVIELEAYAKHRKALAEFQARWRKRTEDRSDRVRRYLKRAMDEAVKRGILPRPTGENSIASLPSGHDANPTGVSVSVRHAPEEILVTAPREVPWAFLRVSIRTDVSDLVRLVENAVTTCSPQLSPVQLSRAIVERLLEEEDRGNPDVQVQAKRAELRNHLRTHGEVPRGTELRPADPIITIRPPKEGGGA